MSGNDTLVRHLRFAARDHRAGKVNSFGEIHTGSLIDAADRIEQLEADNARLREALGEARRFINGGCYIGEREIARCVAIQSIDAALKETDHD